MASTCEVKRIQQNSAQAVVDRANADLSAVRRDYLNCMGPGAAGDAAVADATADMNRLRADAAQLTYIHEFITKHLEQRAGSKGTMDQLGDIVKSERSRLEREIDTLKGKIRKSRRIFLDSSPQISTAVGGLYFTQAPDNQVLIAFIACFGAFLLFSGVGFGLNLGPVANLNLMDRERWSLVGSVWVGAIILTYMALMFFT